jgi:hypothetical protein
MSDLEEKLYNLYLDVNNLLRSAEAKNIGLVAFNIGVIIGMTKLITDYKDCREWLIVFSYVLAMNLLSLFFAFMSIVPQMKHKETEVETFSSDNILFFGRIAQIKSDVFLEEFKRRYNLTSVNAAYETDLARQVVIVSQIALRKMKLFKIAINFTLAGIATPITVIFYKLFFDPNK